MALNCNKSQERFNQSAGHKQALIQMDKICFFQTLCEKEHKMLLAALSSVLAAHSPNPGLGLKGLEGLQAVLCTPGIRGVIHTLGTEMGRIEGWDLLR